MFLKSHKDYTADVIFSDPPYGLGSEVIIKDGKPEYSKASDFMNKWDTPTGAYWEMWFEKAFRTLKHGGYCVMYGMDRQLLLFKYYACLAGFQERQSLYWFFISSLPKASDLSKNLDKHAGAEREKVADNPNERPNCNPKDNTLYEYGSTGSVGGITAPSSPLAKKYNGYKYSISPLKQTNETILVFQKPYKTGSCLHDTLRYEDGNETCCCGALDIDGGRVPTDEKTKSAGHIRKGNVVGDERTSKGAGLFGDGAFVAGVDLTNGRYPAQTFVNKEASEELDRQSGVSKSGLAVKHRSGGKNFGSETPKPQDTGGCSKILHKCDYEKEEQLYFYVPKVSKKERNAGGECRHPTLKPIALNERILKLFKTPNPQKILFPFAGAGSEIIGGIKAGFTDWEGCELSDEYIKIAEARIDYYKKQEESKLL